MSSSIPFDRAAHFYDDSRGFPDGVADPAVKTLADFAGLSAASRVLEVGVGTGRIALPLSRVVQHVVGVDLSRPMMERLRAKQNGEPVHVVQGDATRLPLPNHAFDAAVVVHVFHLIDPWMPAADELRRVLKPDGVAIFANAKSAGRQQFWDLWDQVADTHHPSERRIRRDDVVGALVAAGWSRQDEGYDFPYTIHLAPRRFYQQIADRYFSRLWEYDDAALQAALDRLETALKDSYGDWETPVALESALHIEALRPPS